VQLVVPTAVDGEEATNEEHGRAEQKRGLGADRSPPLRV
jgi:hypothetical protein